jgi:hypothetical protein
MRIEIIGRDDFWSRAFHVEWSDQFPDRELIPDEQGHFVVEANWIEDLERVGEQTFCNVIRAPENPHRRRWLNSIFQNRH